MRKAVLILGLIFMVIILLQSFLVGMGGELFEDYSLARGGAAGRLVGLMYGIAAAFVLSKPFATFIIFILAALLAFALAIPTGYHDLIIWGITSIILGVLSFFGWREVEDVSVSLRKKRKRRTSLQTNMNSDRDSVEN